MKRSIKKAFIVSFNAVTYNIFIKFSSVFSISIRYSLISDNNIIIKFNYSVNLFEPK